jgi:hypothetical protein
MTQPGVERRIVSAAGPAPVVMDRADRRPRRISGAVLAAATAALEGVLGDGWGSRPSHALRFLALSVAVLIWLRQHLQ